MDTGIKVSAIGPTPESAGALAMGVAIILSSGAQVGTDQATLSMAVQAYCDSFSGSGTVNGTTITGCSVNG